MSEERENWAFVEQDDARPAWLPYEEWHEKKLYEAFVAHHDEFEKWHDEQRHKEEMTPRDDEEARVYSCAGWHVYSPRWDAKEALENPNTRSWEDIQIFSTVRSLAWMREHNKGCECVPLRINDQRCAEEKLAKFRRRRSKIHQKQSFTPNADDLGGGDAR